MQAFHRLDGQSQRFYSHLLALKESKKKNKEMNKKNYNILLYYKNI